MYGEAGLLLQAGELPDYLPVVLEFASTRPEAQARAFLDEMAHILNAVHAALVERNSKYGAVIAAVLRIAGSAPHKVATVHDEPFDATWSEPPSFDGCSVKAQASPGQAQAEPQPIHIVRKSPDAGQAGGTTR
jgi:nitrate reductase delta subunit